jgi:hypothetical protein
MSFSLTTLKTQQHGDLEEGLGHAESLLHIRRWLSTPGIAGTVVASTLEQLLPEEDMFLRASWRDAAQRVADFVRGQQTEVVGEERIWVPTQMLSLYRPAVEGAKATISLSADSEHTTSIALEIFGTGGGPEFTVELGWNDKLESEHESLLVNYARLARYSICRIHTRAGWTDPFAKLVELLPDEKLEVRPLPQTHIGLIKEAAVPVTIDLRKQRGILTRKLTTKSGVQWKGRVGIKIEAFGVESSVEYLITRSKETEYEYVLPGGYLYQVVQGESPPDWWWNVPVEGGEEKSG